MKVYLITMLILSSLGTIYNFCFVPMGYLYYLHSTQTDFIPVYQKVMPMISCFYNEINFLTLLMMAYVLTSIRGKSRSRLLRRTNRRNLLNASSRGHTKSRSYSLESKLCPASKSMLASKQTALTVKNNDLTSSQRQDRAIHRSFIDMSGYKRSIIDTNLTDPNDNSLFEMEEQLEEVERSESSAAGSNAHALYEYSQPFVYDDDEDDESDNCPHGSIF